MVEILVDPVLVQWVPGWVQEQYARWNPKFMDHVQKVLQKDGGQAMTNRQVLAATKRRMVRSAQRAKQLQKAEQEAGEFDSDEAGSGESASGSDDGENDDDDDDDDDGKREEDLVKAAMVCDALPTAGGDDPDAGDGCAGGGALTAEQ